MGASSILRDKASPKHASAEYIQQERWEIPSEISSSSEYAQKIQIKKGIRRFFPSNLGAKIKTGIRRVLPSNVGTEPGASLSDFGATTGEAISAGLQGFSTAGVCPIQVGGGGSLALGVLNIPLTVRETYESVQEFRQAWVDKQGAKREFAGQPAVSGLQANGTLESVLPVSNSASLSPRVHAAKKEYKHAAENLFSSVGETIDAVIDVTVGGMAFAPVATEGIAALSGIGGILGIVTSLIPLKRSVTEIIRKYRKSKIIKQLNSNSSSCINQCTNQTVKKLIQMHHEFLLKKRRSWFSTIWSGTNVLRNIAVATLGILGAIGVFGSAAMLGPFIVIGIGAALYGIVIGWNMYSHWKERRDTNILINQFRKQLQFNIVAEDKKTSPFDKNKFLDAEISTFLNLYRDEMTETCLDYLLVLKYVSHGGDAEIRQAILDTAKNKSMIAKYLDLMQSEKQWKSQPMEILKKMRYCREH